MVVPCGLLRGLAFARKVWRSFHALQNPVVVEASLEESYYMGLWMGLRLMENLVLDWRKYITVENLECTFVGLRANTSSLVKRRKACFADEC